MTSQNIFRSFFILAIALIGFGCKSASAPIEQTVTHDPGEFGYTYNSTTIDRKDYPGAASSGSALYSVNPGGSGIDIILTIPSSQASKERSVELRIPMPAKTTGTFTTDKNISITFKLDTVYYYSAVGGTILITRFDTVNNVISGTFNFEGGRASDPANTEHVTTGYFNAIPVTTSILNVGLVTADVNGVLFTSAYATSPPSIYSVDGGQHLVIIVAGDSGNTIIKTLGFGITAPAVDYYDLNSLTGGQWFGTYVQNTPDVASISTTTGAYGRITFTNFDWTTHLMSATFYLHGQDSHTGEALNVTNGKIDNVPWVLK